MNKKEHFNIDVVYPHVYDEEYKSKMYNVSKHATFYDVLVFLMIGGLGAVVCYNMISEMQEKGYMLVIVFIIAFCALLH